MGDWGGSRNDFITSLTSLKWPGQRYVGPVGHPLAAASHMWLRPLINIDHRATRDHGHSGSSSLDLNVSHDGDFGFYAAACYL